MKLIVVEEHKSTYPNPIIFKKGDRVKVGKEDPEFEDWIWVTTKDENQGWAPMQCLHVVKGDKALATQDYTAQELDTYFGDEIFLHYELNGWGWVEKRDGSCGWVPMITTKIA